jgi:hypothetical protein
VSTVLDRLGELKAGERVWADCPKCGTSLPWWIPGNPMLIEADSDYRDDLGLQCDRDDCGYTVSLGPPTILCSVCGGPLELREAGYSCEPCGRTVGA